ncbi:uncharacterized protein LOC116921764 isoform X2 [Daphnia magna]|uniref:uncharacterized protein LOC116921764 isoform X2 n=1 Tax=Daphnia magna TaxID=35525 RepID=UPI001E1BDA72|nr:uncharacterized protein LOC116921764 isoform X2 [Daphnia magna]
MYGTESDNGNWDHMLDGTIESLFNNANAEDEHGELEKLDNQHQLLPTPSSMLAEWLEADEIQKMNQLVTSMSAALDEMEWDRRKCKSSLGDCLHHFERLKSGSSLWMCRLDLLQQAITYDPDMVIALAFYSNISKLAHKHTHKKSIEHLHIPAGFYINHHQFNYSYVKMGRSNDEGDLHKMNKSQQMIRPEKRGDVDRGEGEDSSSLHLASFQGPDNEEILSRIDLLKKNAVSFSSGNQPQRDEAQQQHQSSFLLFSDGDDEPTNNARYESKRSLTLLLLRLQDEEGGRREKKKEKRMKIEPSCYAAACHHPVKSNCQKRLKRRRCWKRRRDKL